MLSIEVDGNIFGFSRNDDGRGTWEVIFGKCPANFSQGSSGRHVSIPLIFASELTKTAIASGIGKAEDFALFPPEPVKVKAPREASGNVRRSKIKGLRLIDFLGKS